jgi:hypothetical protein
LQIQTKPGRIELNDRHVYGSAPGSQLSGRRGQFATLACSRSRLDQSRIVREALNNGLTHCAAAHVV